MPMVTIAGTEICKTDLSVHKRNPNPFFDYVFDMNLANSHLAAAATG